jgi:tripartite-type tricarboxylate transporter receptor subunit TctC
MNVSANTMLRVLLAAGLIASSPVAFAQSYPNRPITMVAGFAAGGAVDTIARVIAKRLSDSVGQSVVVDARPGAGGVLATQQIARGTPDGYTILLAAVGSLAVSPHLVAKIPYDPLRDLAPITMAVVFSNVIVAHPSFPAKTVAELVQLAKAQPGKIAYGTSGIGGTGHLAGALFGLTAGVDLSHVPYKGGAPALQDLLGGQVPLLFATPVSTLPHIKSGKIRAIATTGLTRAAIMPDVPTIAESGYPGFEALNWYAFVAPARTPKEIVARLNREITEILKNPEVQKELHVHGVEAKPSTPEELARFMASELATWGKVVKAANIQAN